MLILLCFSFFSLSSQGFPPEENFEDLLVKADLTPEKRLADFLTDYLIESPWGGSYYEGPTELDISGEITRADLDIIFRINTIKKIDAEHASFMDNTVPSYAFCADAGLYEIGIVTLEEVVLPASVEIIDSKSFTSCERLSKVNFEQLKSLRKIGMNAFDKCAFLSVYIPGKCTDIAETAFAFNMKLKEIVVDPTNVKYEAESNALYNKAVKALILYPKMAENKSLVVKAGTDSIVASCFMGNEILEMISLPNTLTKIGRSAFEQTTKLKSISIPGSVKVLEALFFNSSIEEVNLGEGIEVIGGSSFTRCNNLKSIVLPKSVKEIGFMAFAECKNLTNVNFQDLSELSLIDSRAFYACKSLEMANLSNSNKLNVIANSSFKDCSSLHSLMLPDGLKIIEAEAFMNCELLDLKIYPSSLTHIGSYAFGNNRSLTTISIGDHVVELGNGVFGNCRNVTDLSVSENNSSYILYENMIMTMDGSAVVYVSPNTSIEELDLSEMKELCDYVLAGNKSIKRVILGSGLTSIGIGAFEDMAQLNSISLSHCAELTNIGSSAFKGAVNLTSVIFPKDDSSKFLEFGESAFEGCSLLEEVTLPAQTGSIGLYLFKDCLKLRKADFSKSKIMSINDAFINCESLSVILLNNKISRFSDNAFKNCKSLESLEIPSSLSYNLNAMPFIGSGIKSFTVSAENRSYSAIGGAVYSKDGSQLVICPPTTMGEYVIPEGVKKIGTKAFAGIHTITKIHLPSTLEKPQYQNIEDSFYEMHGLTSFVAKDDHANLTVLDGAIYSKDKKTLYAYPAGKMDKVITLAPELEVVNRAAFDNNKIVEEIRFPANMKRLGMSFINATGLRKIELPAGFTSMSSSFNGATNLSEVVCHAVTPPSIDTYSFRNTNVTSVYVPKSAVDAYKANKYWGEYTILPIDPLAVDKVHDADMNVLYLDGKVIVEAKDAVQSVNVFNVAGQMIKQSFENSFTLNAPKGVVVVVVKLENGKILTSKLIVR